MKSEKQQFPGHLLYTSGVKEISILNSILENVLIRL